MTSPCDACKGVSGQYDENERLDAIPVHHERSQAGAAAMPAQQRTILLIDDDHEILESMRVVLENKGFRILVARDGNAGLMIAERENPDMLVLDMMMPKKSGFLVLEKLKSRPGGLIPTIMITANEGSRHRAYAEMLGVRDYIRKPFAMEKLVRAVEKVLGIKTRAGGFGDEEA
jgi:DNA-binding response OmpR family regulator